MKKSYFRRGFTLIELMIVIVILGVLMGTILPRITGIQSKAKDTGFIADINAISQALEVYYSENNRYPGTPGVRECISYDAPTGTDANEEIKGYLKGNKVPSPGEAQTWAVGTYPNMNAIQCDTNQSYIYLPLSGGDYALISKISQDIKGNADADLDAAYGSSTDLDAISTNYGTPGSDADSLYLTTN